jgi:starvation-inducible outer membrane lipoprotein
MFSFPQRMKAVLLVLTCLLASCASLPPQGGDSLVGEWRYADNVQSCGYHFKRDGHFTGEVRLGGKLASKFTGTWNVQGDLLSYKYISDELGRIPAGATDRDKLLSVQRGSFLIEAADGSRRRYLRVR